LTLRAVVLALALSLLATLPAAATEPIPSSSSISTPITVTKKRLNVRAGGRAAVVGRLPAVPAGATAVLEVRRAGRWVALDRDRIGAAHAYALRERLSRVMSVPARIRVEGAVRVPGRRLGRLNVYRTALASWYGPGLFGRRTGCGSTLRAGLRGVAHKTLPCGSRVTLRYDGRVVRVPVIDRGPYVGAREFDLTSATAQALGFTGHGAIQVAR
jgi:rare lipoprotein A (peptidoglycan hydrolase)